MNDHQKPVLVCKDLCISYYTRAGEIPAVVDFSLTVLPGETIGIVGESGCGKSTVAMAVMQYMGANGGIKSGSITFKDRDLNQMSEDELRRIRGSEIAMIYQEPFASLNPSLKISTQLMEVPLAHEDISKEEARQRAVQMLADVKLPDPERL
ncbi:MAG: ABC transporter ATP-binding protein, partial [Rhodobacteraceae bacterium]|nr:ABC transporter ATP-binding protein [Paracoccaceae bacterium]